MPVLLVVRDSQVVPGLGLHLPHLSQRRAGVLHDGCKRSSLATVAQGPSGSLRSPRQPWPQAHHDASVWDFIETAMSQRLPALKVRFGPGADSKQHSQSGHGLEVSIRCSASPSVCLSSWHFCSDPQHDPRTKCWKELAGVSHVADNCPGQATQRVDQVVKHKFGPFRVSQFRV